MRTRRLWIVVIALAVLTPFGLWLPARFGAGGAWGEWSAREIGERLGYTPRGMAKVADRWDAPAPGYSPQGWERKPILHRGAAYLASAIAGAAAVVVIVFLLGRILTKRGRVDAS